MNHYNGYYDDKFQFWSPEMEGGESSDGSLRQDEEVMLAASHPKKRAGRKKFQETRHPVYRGVRQRSSGKWVSEVREPYKQSRIWLGTFPTPEMAARAHDVAVLALRGRSACLNFADSSWRSPAPATLDPNDIRKAAVEAAEAFRPAESGGDVTVAVPENEGYVDEEAELDMPALLDNMAEGLMLPPPPSSYGGGDGYYGDDVEYGGEVSLWSYSL